MRSRIWTWTTISICSFRAKPWILGPHMSTVIDWLFTEKTTRLYPTLKLVCFTKQIGSTIYGLRNMFIVKEMSMKMSIWSCKSWTNINYLQIWCAWVFKIIYQNLNTENKSLMSIETIRTEMTHSDCRPFHLTSRIHFGCTRKLLCNEKLMEFILEFVILFQFYSFFWQWNWFYGSDKIINKSINLFEKSKYNFPFHYIDDKFENTSPPQLCGKDFIFTC